MSNFIKTLARDDHGQDLVEYALLIVIIMMAVGLAAVAFREEIVNLFTRSATEVSSY